MSCFWRHKWSTWSAPKAVLMQQMYNGKKIDTCTDDMQTRTCRTCNKIEERTI